MRNSAGGGHPNRPVTITDVARAAGVSASTVSRAFSRPGRVNIDTATRIRKVADELGYRTRAVVSFADGKRATGQIACVVSDLGNSLFANYVKSAQHESLKRGYCLLVIDAEESAAVERRAVEFVRDHVDGIVLGSSRCTDTAIRKLAETVPTVTLNRPIRGVRSVICDVRMGLTQAVDRLLELGHAAITYVSGPDSSWQEGMRWQTMLQLSHGRGFSLRRIASTAPSCAGGSRAAAAFLESPTTAVVAYNDLIAVGLMTTLQKRGVRVPDDVSVVGIDDIPLGSLITPRLSTIWLPATQVAARAVAELIGGLHRVPSRDAFKPILLDSEFIERESIAPARG